MKRPGEVGRGGSWLVFVYLFVFAFGQPFREVRAFSAFTSRGSLCLLPLEEGDAFPGNRVGKHESGGE